MTDSNSSRPLAVSPADGPVAVTGASGYVGSWIVRELVEQGYRVHSCVRDPGRPEKVDHLLAMNHQGLPGSNTLFTADLLKRGSYDDAFEGCCAVMHAGAVLTRHQATPQEVYDGCFTVVDHVIESVRRAGTVRRLVLTSSFSAVSHPADEGYVYTEKDWCTDNIEDRPPGWSEEDIPNNRHAAYAYGKARAEQLIYRAAEQDGRFESISVLPLDVIGPVMCANHDEAGWHVWIRRMLQGEPFTLTPGGRMLWNNIDVRDVAAAHRLCAESTVARNGSRYILAASDRSGELFTWQLQTRLKELFPRFQNIGGEEMDGDRPKEPTFDKPRSYCTLAMRELGLKPYSINESLKATVDSFVRLGVLPVPNSS
ncbi:MAG: NAD-dependent epimerase/dehydratase family protein [Gammaproteobacteria bacterium]|nr:NAD-dependent epimerase/dehydratase family protein [Gammaproteobacteria bacterium]